MRKGECLEYTATIWNEGPNSILPVFAPQVRALGQDLTMSVCIGLYDCSILEAFCQVLLGKPLGDVDSPLTPSTINSFISFLQRISDFLQHPSLAFLRACHLIFREQTPVLKHCILVQVAFFIWLTE